MSHEHGDLFLLLDPPAGGLVALRARLDEKQRRRWMVIPAIAAGFVIALALVLREPRSTHDFGTNPALVRLGLEPRPTERVAIHAGHKSALATLHVGVGDIDFYWIAGR